MKDKHVPIPFSVTLGRQDCRPLSYLESSGHPEALPVMTRCNDERQSDGHTDLALAGGQPLGEVLLLPTEEALLLLRHHLDLPHLAPSGPGLAPRPLGPGPPPQH